MSKLIILGANPKHFREHLFLTSKFETVISFGNEPIPYIKEHYQISVYNILEIINKIECTNLNDFKIFSRFSGEKLFVRYIIETYFGMQSTSYHIYKSAVDKTYMRLFFEKLNIPTTTLATDITNSVVKPAISKIGKIGVKKLDSKQQFKRTFQSIINTAENIDLNIENILGGTDFTVFIKYGNKKINHYKIIEEKHEFKNGDLTAADHKVSMDSTVWKNVEDHALALAPYCGNNDVITLHFKYNEKLGPIFYELGFGLGGDNFFENTNVFTEWEMWLKC
jgi:hypothetical protein